MKKKIYFLSLFFLLSIVLVGCGNKNQKQEEGEEKNNQLSSQTAAYLEDYIDNLANLQKLEGEAYKAISDENGAEFDSAAAKIEAETQRALDNLKRIQAGKKTASRVFFPVALAKEKSSFFYHMPVTKHIANAYDEALKNKKIDVCNYLEKEVDKVSRDNILKRNNIKSLEAFKKLDNKIASELINSDPELYKAVSWKKIATDVGKAGINAFVDALKGDNPLSAKEIVKDYISEEFKDSQKKKDAKVKAEKGQGTVFGINKKFKDEIDNIIPYQEADDYVTTKEDDAEIARLLDELDETVIFGRKLEEEDEQEVSLPAGDWVVTLGIPDQEMNEKEIMLKKDEVVKINPAEFGLNEFIAPEVGGEVVEEEVVEDKDIVGKWKPFNITGENINSKEYMAAWGDTIPDIEFFEDGTVMYTFVDKEGGLGGTYTFDGETGVIKLGTTPYMGIELDGDELRSASLLDTSSSNPITWHYKRKSE